MLVRCPLIRNPILGRQCVRTAVTLKVKDYVQNSRRSLIILYEKGGKEKEIPYHHPLEAYLNTYI